MFTFLIIFITLLWWIFLGAVVYEILPKLFDRESLFINTIMYDCDDCEFKYFQIFVSILAPISIIIIGIYYFGLLCIYKSKNTVGFITDSINKLKGE